MNLEDVLETLPVTAWHGPLNQALTSRAVAALEAGRVIFLPQLPFVLTAEERRFLEPAVLGGERKNISLDPGTGRIANVALPPADASLVAAMMMRFAEATAALLADLLPPYAASLERARTSFRPAEIAGRSYSPRHDDRRLHIDAFPTRPTAGRRILRVFCNVAADGTPREWEVGERFANFARAFVPRVTPALLGSAYALQLLGLTKGRRTAYDHIMLGLHDTGKLDIGYQAGAPKVPVSFAAGTAWLCFTDQVLHAALSGHGVLEQTFYLPIEAMTRPEQAPLRVLEDLLGRMLA